MNIVVLGGRGMAGHMVAQYLGEGKGHDVWWTARDAVNCSHAIQLDVSRFDDVEHVLSQLRPDFVINAVGLLNRQVDAHLPEAIYVNSLFPHRLAQLGDVLHFGLIHISTDCVFSGARGTYCESDVTDGVSAYAKTKSLGEVVNERHLTIRTSIIGPELKPHGIGLFHWFMHQSGQIQGYQNVYWNGITTLQLAKVIDQLMRKPAFGLVHVVAPCVISKYALLQEMRRVFVKKDVTIVPDSSIQSDKTLVSTRKDIAFGIPDYATMLQELKNWMNMHEQDYCSLYPDLNSLSKGRRT